MGVLTTAYSVPPAMMKKIKADHENLGFVFGVVEDGAEAWKCEEFGFDKGFEERIGILGENGCPKTQEALDLECADEADPTYDGYDVRAVSPATVKKIAKELASATFEELKTRGLANGITDYYGKPIPADAYSHYVGDIEQMKTFFAKVAAAGHWLVIAAA
jgi:hypothetical protein